MIDLQGYGPRLIEGAGVTIQLAVLSLILAIILGLLTASAKMSRNWLAHRLATLYTTLIRGVPDLVLMMLFFFGGQIGVNMITDWLYYSFDIDIFININAFVAGVVTIGLIFGAYMGETFRGAFMAVDNGQIEAGKAYGMSDGLVFRRVRFPQMMRHALPGLSNNWMVLLKTTALVSVIGLSDMVRVASEASKATREPFTFMIIVALIYLLIASVSEWIFARLQKRYNIGYGEAD
ncbi:MULTISPECIES: ABC transporter permease [Halomonadaceae]|uniref:ABC transporter permease n=1 Tax=Vreelandella titanicae TaxID=664683 RepID=A0A558J805_9GAMM|nr:MULTISPECIES: ABC transporter permease [Halomonas]MBR9902641.1 ABC transporter permease [Gammaproteobacteria bacterium]NAO95212.1 ABC transporter permease subunit [Halomonas sp. MG34]EHA14621.1 ABC transporter permease [Halomonas sp. HAL1]QKS24364.1 Histidine transport system permease protein HisQ [Halomonas titanicae]TVU89642.1 ABC transporter permease [Halomonas titanicae]|tara:strand:- start:339 stop:1043 length:705 start_codon:yes stop_codon:yes gene_type:complete